jgi:hypothetical protein
MLPTSLYLSAGILTPSRVGGFFSARVAPCRKVTPHHRAAINISRRAAVNQLIIASTLSQFTLAISYPRAVINLLSVQTIYTAR